MSGLVQIPIRYIEVWDSGLGRYVTMRIGGAWVPKDDCQAAEEMRQVWVNYGHSYK